MKLQSVYSPKVNMALFLLIIFILFRSSDTAKEKKLVKCYNCLSMTCVGHSIDSDFCSSLQHFVQKSLKSFYHIGTPELPACPNPIDDDIGWETLKTVIPNPLTCPGPCTLGRFQLTSQIDEERIINHGTVLGCPTVQLLGNIYYPNRRKLKKDRQQTCHWENVTSVVNLGQHVVTTMTLEHCPRSSDICDFKDFCIEPAASVVIPFDNDLQATSNSSFVTWLICVGIFIGLLVLFATFAGIKYGA